MGVSDSPVSTAVGRGVGVLVLARGVAVVRFTVLVEEGAGWTGDADAAGCVRLAAGSPGAASRVAVSGRLCDWDVGSAGALDTVGEAQPVRSSPAIIPKTTSNLLMRLIL